MLATSGETICFLIIKGRQYHAKVTSTLREDASDLPDDPLQALVENPLGDSVEEELVAAMNSLNERELTEVSALVRLGQGEFVPADWEDAVEEARAAIEPATPRQLLAIPQFASFLEDGYNQLGYSCAEWESGHL